MNYKHLSQVERYQIYALMKAGHDQTQIAKLLDRHKLGWRGRFGTNKKTQTYQLKHGA